MRVTVAGLCFIAGCIDLLIGEYGWGAGLALLSLLNLWAACQEEA